MRDDGSWSQRSLALGVAATIVTFAVAWVASVVAVRSLAGMSVGAAVGVGGGLRTMSEEATPAPTPAVRVPPRPRVPQMSLPRMPSFALPQIPSLRRPTAFVQPGSFFGTAIRRQRPSAVVRAAHDRFVADALSFGPPPRDFVIRQGRVLLVEDAAQVPTEASECAAAVAGPDRRVGDGRLIDGCAELVSDVALLLRSVEHRVPARREPVGPVRSLIRSRAGR